jgi:predicted RND superfamily exporter protein
MNSVRSKARASNALGVHRLTEAARRAWEGLVALQTRRPFVPIAIALFVAAIGGFLATRLELKTRFDQLLPDHQPSVVELRRVQERTDASSKILVFLEGDDTAKLRGLGDAIVPRVRAIGAPYVVSANDGVQDARAFLSPRAGLFAKVSELEKLRDDIQARWDWEVRQKIDEWKLEEDDAPPPPVTSEEIKKRFSRGDDDDSQSLTDRFPDGYYQAKDGKSLVVDVRTAIASGELDKSRESLARVQAAVEDARKSGDFAGVKVGYAGDLVTGLAEYGAIKGDLVSVGVLGTSLVLGVVFLFFMRVRALVAMGITIVCGLAWTFGLTELAIGHLNVATGFLFSIVAGNGINFGIIYMARYFEERRKGSDPSKSVVLAHRGTWAATLTAALAAAASYGSLGITDFRAFKHFAFIGSAGMVVCWIATYLMLPAVLVLYERVRPFTAESPLRSFIARVRMNGVRYDAPFAAIVPRAPRFFAIAGVLLAIGGVVLGARYVQSDPMEYNMRRLQNDVASSAEMYRVASAAAGILGAKIESSMVLLADDVNDVVPLKKMLEARRDAAPPEEKPFQAVHTLFDFVPDDQASKLPVLAQIRKKILRAREYGHITDEDWPEIERMLPLQGLVPYNAADLPFDVARPFTEKDGTRGRLVLVEPTAGKNGDTDLHYLLRWSDSLRETKLENGDVVRGSGRAVIFADMLKSIVADMPRAIALSLGMTALAVIVIFRRGASTVAVLCALAIGLAWLALYVAATNVKVNFFNFIALPITFGIGVDYAVNFIARYDLEKQKSGILSVLKNTGGAVILCSLTTTLGYLALIGSINQAIRSLGMVAVMGEVCCMLTAVLVLPAFLLWRERTRKRNASMPDAEEATPASESTAE